MCLRYAMKFASTFNIHVYIYTYIYISYIVTLVNLVKLVMRLDLSR